MKAIRKYKIFLIIFAFVLLLAFLTHEKKTGYSKTAKINYINKVIDFGKLKKGCDTIGTILIIKDTLSPLLIREIKYSDSTFEFLPISRLYNKDTISISFKYKTGKQLGAFSNEISISGNFPEQKVVIRVIGEIIK